MCSHLFSDPRDFDRRDHYDRNRDRNFDRNFDRRRDDDRFNRDRDRDRDRRTELRSDRNDADDSRKDDKDKEKESAAIRVINPLYCILMDFPIYINKISIGLTYCVL